MTDQPIPCGKCERVHARCAAHRRDGEPCTQRARLGQRVCKMHGGNTPAGLEVAKRRVEIAAAQQAVVTYGLPRDIDAGQALLEEIQRTAGHIAWLAVKISAFDESALVWGVVSAVDKEAGQYPGTDTTRAAAPPVLLELYIRERRHLVEVCRVTLAAGVEERRVRLEEGRAQMVAVAFGRSMDAAGLHGEARQVAVGAFLASMRELEGVA